MRHYKFNALCNSGTWKIFECDAENFEIARNLLDEFVRNN